MSLPARGDQDTFDLKVHSGQLFLTHETPSGKHLNKRIFKFLIYVKNNYVKLLFGIDRNYLNKLLISLSSN